MKYVGTAIAIGTALSMFGCSKPADDSHQTAAQQSAAAPPPYIMADTKDAISDAETISAKAQFRSDNGLNTSSITWACTRSADKSDSELTLTISSFGAPTDGGRLDGAAFDSDQSKETFTYNLPIKVVKLRVNGQSPVEAKCGLIPSDAITTAFSGINQCRLENSISIDPIKSAIGLPAPVNGHVAFKADDKIVYQYTVDGQTYTYTAPLNEQVSKVVNSCATAFAQTSGTPSGSAPKPSSQSTIADADAPAKTITCHELIGGVPSPDGNVYALRGKELYNDDTLISSEDGVTLSTIGGTVASASHSLKGSKITRTLYWQPNGRAKKVVAVQVYDFDNQTVIEDGEDICHHTGN